jgi:hypothetical protein
MDTTDTLCFADFDPVTGPPKVDGFTGIDDAGVITTESEPGYVLGSRLTYSNSTQFPPVIFQGVKNGNFLNLSFFCRFDSSFDAQDLVIIAFKPSPTDTVQSHARRIDIFPNYDGIGADEIDVNTGVGPNGCPDNKGATPAHAGCPGDNIPGIPVGDDFHIRTNHTPQSVIFYRGEDTGLPWTTSNADHSPFRPPVSVKVRSWMPPVPANTPSEYAWSIEVQVPLQATPGPSDWINLPDSFGLYFNVIRVGAGPDPVEGLGFPATEFKFPVNSADLTDQTQPGGFAEGLVIPAYGTGLIPALQHPPGSNLGLGVSFINGESGVGVRNANLPAWSGPLDHVIRGASDPTPGDNRLVAQVQNTATTAAGDAQGVSVTFRFANWGLGPSGFAMWQTPVGATPDPGPPPMPSHIADIPHGGQAELTWTWPKAAVPTQYNPPNQHQCVWVQLDSAHAVNFTQSSVRRNLDFVNLSDFERPAHISGVGYPRPASGKTHHDFVLVVNVRQLRGITDDGEFRAPAAVLKQPVQWIWILSGYRRTGNTITLRRKTFEVLDASPGAFGFVFNHGDITDQLKYSLTGGGIRPVGSNMYSLQVPNGGEVVINTGFKTAPPEPEILPHAPYIDTWLVLGPIFDPSQQPAPAPVTPSRPTAAEIIEEIDNLLDQLSPTKLTSNPTNGPVHGDIVPSYGGKLIAARPYLWRERYFAGMQWNSINDIRDDIHTHLVGDYDEDQFDPYDDLNFAGKHHCLVFFLAYIVSPDDRTTRIGLRHADSLRVWLNGAEIHKNLELPFVGDHNIAGNPETVAQIRLHRGTNMLLAAVSQTDREWGFSARIEHYEGLQITAERPGQSSIVACTSAYEFLCIAGDGNCWNPQDLDRALFCSGNKIWRGRVRLLNEDFKFVAHTAGHQSWSWWGTAGLKGPPFHNRIPGLYDVTFNEELASHPVLVLVKPFAARS